MPRILKPHLCEECGETNPDNFYTNFKSACKKCTLEKNRKYQARPEIKEKTRAHRAEYNARPEIKARKAEQHSKYYARPEIKERISEYNSKYYQKPENKTRILEKQVEYYAVPENKEKRAKYGAEYRAIPENKEKLSKYFVEYNQNPENKERRAEYGAEYRSVPENKERISKKGAEYYAVPENKARILAKQVEYRSKPENKEKMRVYKIEYERNRKQTDHGYRFIRNLRSRQRDVLKGKVSTTEGLGCNTKELEDIMASKFTEGMTLSNQGCGKGKWNMDHIIPISSYQKDANGEWDKDSEYNKKLIHYTNLQPLWHEDNLKKGRSINSEELANFLNRVI